MIFFVLLFFCNIAFSHDNFSHFTEELRFALQRNDAIGLRTSALALLPILKQHTHDPLDKSLFGQVEYLYSTLKMVGEVPLFPLWQQWVVQCCKRDYQDFLEARAEVFNQLFPVAKLLHKKVAEWENVFEQKEKEAVKKKKQNPLADDTHAIDYYKDRIIKARIFHEKVQNYSYRAKDSKFYLSVEGSTNKTGLWFDSNQKSTIDTLTHCLDAYKPTDNGLFASEEVRKVWVGSAHLLIDHLIVLNQMHQRNVKVSDLPELQYLYENKVALFANHIQGPLLVKLLFLSSGLVGKHLTSPQLYIKVLEKVNAQLFDLHKETSNHNKTIPISNAQKVFLYKVLRFEMYVQKKSVPKNDIQWSLEDKNKWELVNQDFKANVDEMYKIFKIKNKVN